MPELTLRSTDLFVIPAKDRMQCFDYKEFFILQGRQNRITQPLNAPMLNPPLCKRGGGGGFGFGFQAFSLSSKSRIFIGSSARRIFCVSAVISGRLVERTRCLMVGTWAENIENWRKPMPRNNRV